MKNEKKVRTIDHILLLMLYDQYPEEIHAYAAKTVPNVFGSDELTLAQAQKLTLEWPLWLDAIKIEFISLIVTNEVFEPVDRKDVPPEKQSKILNLLTWLKCKFGEIIKQKARLVMDGSTTTVLELKLELMYLIRMHQLLITL